MRKLAEEYKPYVLIAYDKKIVNGNHDNCFEPNRNITRAEASVMAVRLIDKNGGIKEPDNGNGPNNNSGDVHHRLSYTLRRMAVTIMTVVKAHRLQRFRKQKKQSKI